MIKNISFQSTDKGCSFFDFISDYWMCTEASQDRAFHRLCSLMRKMEARSVVIEEIDPKHPAFSEELFAIERYVSEQIDSRSYRFTFLSCPISGISDLRYLGNENFLASVNVINFKYGDCPWISYIQKAIVSLPKKSNVIILNSYVHLYRPFRCQVHLTKTDTHEFTIVGTYFCQQNGLTSRCAHACLCMLINNLNITADEISTEWVNKSIGIDHVTKKTEKGLFFIDMATVLSMHGLKLQVCDFSQDKQLDYSETLYRYIESRCPPLFVFSTSDPNEWHVVTVIGHTLNSDIWNAEAEIYYHHSLPFNYRSSSAWVDHLIIHDDNLGMYYCLPVDSLNKKRHTEKGVDDQSFRPKYCIAIVPDKINNTPREAEWACAATLRRILQKVGKSDNAGKWLRRLADDDNTMVIRTLLVNKVEYINHLLKDEDFEGNRHSVSEVSAITGHLPAKFWLSEVSLPDLYTANKTKILDFIYPADVYPVSDETPDEMFDRWIQIKYPGACHIRSTDQILANIIKSHLPLLKHESMGAVPEW